MVNVTTSESPVTQEIDSGSSITVPSNEVWRVNITAMIDMDFSTPGDADAAVSVNGTDCIGFSSAFDSSETNAHYTGNSVRVVLVGNDTVGFTYSGRTDLGTNPGCLVSGFKVQNTVDNTPVSEQVTPGESISIPSGEVWKVNADVNNGKDQSSTEEAVWWEINGVSVSGSILSNSPNSEMILSDGDTITLRGSGTADGTSQGGMISGFVVNQ